MAKKTDPFDKFREATLGGGNPLSGALQGKSIKSPGSTPDSASLTKPAKVSKNANRKLVSFHIDHDIFLQLGRLKFEMGTKYDDLYNEAVKDLLVKYGRL